MEAAMVVRRWSDLDRRERHRELARATLSVVVTWVVLFAVYYVFPFNHRTGGSGLVRLLAALIVFAGVFAGQFWQIIHADLPEVRAVQSLAVVIPIFLVLFSVLYLTLSASSVTNFNRPLNHTSALYFTIMTFSTVGYGDITPRGSTAQLLVSSQMLLDLVILGSVVRLLLYAARSGLSRDDDPAQV
jgi:voltage-gated potassium channel